MAFDNVTLFELNLPNEVLGRRGDDSDVEQVEIEDRAEQDDQSSGGSKGKLLLVTLVLAGVAVAVRRFRSGDEEEDVEMAYEEPGVEVEQHEV